MSAEGAGRCTCEATLYNLCLIVETGRSAWRLEESKFHSYLQKGKKEDLENYRPVSLTLIAGKGVQQLVLKNISRHMNDKKIIRSSQHLKLETFG